MCFYCTAFGQWVVSDPALTQLSQITWAKELKQAYEQFQVLGESRDILTKSLDLYRQVNGVIKNSKMVLQVLSMQGEMLELAAKECTRVGRVYRTGGIRGIYERAEQDHGGKRAFL